MPACIEWGQERQEECSAEEDQGYSECTEQEDQGYNACCDWAPCSWFCDSLVWVTNIVCVASTWNSNVVCVAWTWVTTPICVAWDIVTTIVNVVVVTLESTVGWLLSAIAVGLELLQAVPVLGTVVRWFLNGLSYVLGAFFSLVDAGFGILGIRPEKKLRLCTVILKDGNGTQMAQVPDVVVMLQLAADVYKRDANIRIIPLRPFKYSTGFLGAETVDASWVQVDGENSPPELLDSPCNPLGEWWLAGSRFQLKVTAFCFFGAYRRVLGYGAPITVFIDRSTPDALGCALGIVDYVTVNGKSSVPGGAQQSPRTIGHEAAHACMLGHTCVDAGANNIMAVQGLPCLPKSSTAIDRFDPIFEDWQVILARSSKHVSYF